MSEAKTPPPGQERAGHTKVPWSFDGHEHYTDHGGKFREILGADREPVVGELGSVSHEDAALIVRAVNCHDDLVKALEHARRNLVVAIRAAGGGDPEEHVTIKEIDAVLQRVRGGQP